MGARLVPERARSLGLREAMWILNLQEPAGTSGGPVLRFAVQLALVWAWYSWVLISLFFPLVPQSQEERVSLSALGCLGLGERS